MALDGVLLDPEDEHLLSEHTWYIGARGYVMANGKMVDRQKAPGLYLHRVVAGCTPGDGMHVDHLNHNKLDNRRQNLRAGTRAQNAQNARSHRDANDPVRGICWDKYWQVYRVNRMRHGVTVRGQFKNRDDALAFLTRVLEAEHV